VAGQPLEVRLATCPIACDTLLDGVLHTPLHVSAVILKSECSVSGKLYRIAATTSRADQMLGA
jgi:hypothetical protein